MMRRRWLPAFAPHGAPRIRNMRRSDLSAVMAIENAAYEFGWSSGNFHDCLRAGYVCHVLEDDGDVVGYGILSAGAGEAHVLNVCVLPDRQAHGHGRKLVMDLLASARSLGAGQVFLEVRPSNVVARHLYEDLGFHEIGRRPGYYRARIGREDAIVMAMVML